MDLEHKIFADEAWDYFVVARNSDDGIQTIYEGHSLERAYKTILDDIGHTVPIEERDMSYGDYTPQQDDFYN